MESTFRPHNTTGKTMPSGFNPCFNGINIQTPLKGWPLKGWPVSILVLMESTFRPVSQHPAVSASLVSILVLMESTFRLGAAPVANSILSVSILVLMESTFRQGGFASPSLPLIVSILVLMESTFRRQGASPDRATTPKFQSLF